MKSREDQERRLKRRFQLVYTVLLCIGLLLIGRLFDLQIVNGSAYMGEAVSNRTRILSIPASRGRIIDVNGVVLADSRQTNAVLLFDLHNNNMQQVAPLLAQILEDPKTVAEAVYDSIYGYYPVNRLEPYVLARDISDKQQTMILERIDQLPGVRIEKIPVREYPMNTLMAHTIGHLGPLDEDDMASWAKEANYLPNDLVGKMGLERSYENQLRGQPGYELVEVDVSQNIIRVIDRIEPIPGNDIYLTIDSQFQLLAEEMMQQSITTMRYATPLKRASYAYSGSVVALDPLTGKVLAMASYPNFDPNHFATGSLSDDAAAIYFNQSEQNTYPRPMVNRAILESLPPGSVYKPVTLAASLEMGLVGVRETVNCTGLYNVVDPINPPRCWVYPGGHGSIYSSQALRDSCNCYFYEMGRRLYGLSEDNSILDQYAAAFGLGEDTGFTDLSYTPEGDIASTRRSNLTTKQWEHELWDITGTPIEDVVFYEGEACFSAIGQAFNAFTPLQVALMTAQIANKGERPKPFIVEKIVSPRGDLIYQAEVKVQETLNLQESTWNAIHEGLKMVTEYPGTSYSVTIGREAVRPWEGLPFKVAAKTGTAQIANDPLDERAHGWFTAFAPAEAPKIALAMMVENGRSGSDSCSATASALIRSMMGQSQMTFPFITN